MSASPDLTLDGVLSVEDVHRAATTETTIRLDVGALRAVAENRVVLEQAIADGDQIYGITTGFGALVTHDVPAEQARQAQVNLLRSHAAGHGDPLPRAVVRAALLIRLNGLLRAHSGIRPEVLERVVLLLNRGLVPVTPRVGSLGASGDLAPSAHAFLPLIGEGELIDSAGQVVPGAEALRRLDLEPLVLEPKEALALMNGTHFMAGIGALLAFRLSALLDTADAAAAMSLEGLQGASAAFDARVHQLRGLEGQATSAANIRALIAGSDHVGATGPYLQDAYSLRCAAQVHGAAREAVAFFTRVAEADLDAVTDNPLVFAEPPNVVSAGNFHGQALALAFDTVRVALADLAAISERRTFRMLSPSISNGLPPFLSLEAGPSSGYMVAQYTAAALLVELRALAHPVSCDSVPSSDNQEDHVSMGMTAATMALEAMRRVEAVVGIELMCGAQAIDCRGGTPGRGTAAVHDLIRRRIETLVSDRQPAPDIEAAAALVSDGDVAALVDEVVAIERIPA